MPVGLSAEVAADYRKAQKSDPTAMYSLGKAYATGTGAPEDYAQALGWFRKSAEAGNAREMDALGVMYVKGFGVQHDYQQAVSWFRKAAEVS